MFARLPIRTKIAALVAVLLLAMSGLGVLGIFKMRALNENTVDIATNWLPSVRELGNIRSNIAMYRNVVRGSLMELDANKKSEADRRVSTLGERIKQIQTKYEKLISSPEEQRIYDNFAREWRSYTDEATKVLALANNTRGQYPMEAAEYLAKTLPQIGERVDDFLQKDIDLNDKGADESTTTAASTYGSALVMVIVIIIASVALGIVASVVVIRDVSQGIGSIVTPMQSFTRGDLSADVPHRGETTEIGQMADALQVFKEALIAKRTADEAAAKDAQDKIARGQRIDAATRQFESSIGQIVGTVSTASSELESSASTLTATAERSQELATTVSAASEEASTNVQSVASATEEMTSSITEISRQVQESARIANEAVDQARKTNDRVGELSQAAARIGDVVELINTIAGQTNLLALNATIEAARAGDAGRGFAVVASEVKALAEQTAKATGEIGQHIAGIQSATNESVHAIREIGEIIGRMSEISSTIASAVEEQGAATQEISRNVQEAARGTQEVSSNITDVRHGATQTGSASAQVLSAAQSLSRDSAKLKVEVAKFLDTVRAA